MATDNKKFLDLDGLTRYNDRVRTRINTVDSKVDNEKVARISADNDLHAQISGVASGAPLAASSTADMTDTTKIYVNTTDGNWYYWNGAAWTSGGTYQASVDPDDVTELRNEYLNLSLPLELVAVYDGVFYGNSTELKNGDAYKTYKYRIPKYITKIELDCWFYGLLRIYFSNVTDPTEVALNADNSYTYPTSSYGTMTNVQEVFDTTTFAQYDYVYVPQWINKSTPSAQGYYKTGFDSLQLGIDSLGEEIIETRETLPVKLEKIGLYHGYWTGSSAAMIPSDSFTTYKYEIPEGVTQLYIKTKFYGLMSIYFTDISDPTTEAITKSAVYGTAFADPYNYYDVLEEREKTYNLSRYYRYVYVPAYDPYGEPTVIAYKGSAINKNWEENNPLYGKKVLFFGDSITHLETYWRKYFLRITRATQLDCISCAGAHLADYNTTTPLDGDYTNTGDGGVHNVVCNQVYYWINNAPEGANPDFIIISAGTNDYYTSPSQLETDVNVYATADGWIDVDTVNRTTFEGAMRWITTKLREKHPNAQIIFESPIQSAQDWGDSKSIDVFLAKEAKMERACNHLSAKLIKATSQSGITGEFEHKDQNGRYLVDGLHPNQNGAIQLGTFYANSMISMFSKKDDWDTYSS